MRFVHFTVKAGLLASIAASGLATAAYAEQAAPAAATTTTTTTAADLDTTEGEIIVTATKRALTLLDTPISVAVASKQQIQQSQVRDLLDLPSLVPSLKVGQLQSSSNTNFIIRGFGNGANNAGIEPSVAVFIDGVYRSRSAAQIADLPNIDRVEVLRGPQSTLFGKNASAGVISIVTEAPQFSWHGSGEVSYGNYNAIVGKADLTGPISDTLAFSISGNVNKRDGYGEYVNLHTDANNRDRWGVRGQLLWKPTDSLRLRLIADYDSIDEVCCIVANVFDGPTGNAVRALGGQVNSNNPFSYDSYANFPSTNKIENYGISLQTDWDVNDKLTLTNISSYRASRSLTNQDSDFTSADLIGENKNRTDIDTYTTELRLASNFDGFFNFLVGGFYFNEKIDINSDLTFGKDFKNYANLLSGGGYSAVEPILRGLIPGLPAGTFGGQGQGVFENYNYKNQAISIFGQLDFKITDKLTFTAGGNYTDDRKQVVTNDTSTDVFSQIDLVQAGYSLGVLPPAYGGLGLTPAQAHVFASSANNPFLPLQPLQFLPQFLNFPNAVEDGRTHDHNFSYTLRASYKFNSNLSAYATYATGFKASSFNLSRDSRPFAADFIPGSPFGFPTPLPSAIRTALGASLPNNLTSGTRYAGPENSEVYEFGLKANYEGFAVNFAIFKQSIAGFQSNIFTGSGFVLGNAELESTFGIEVDTSITPVKALNVTASLTYLQPKYDKFTGGSAFNAATNSVVPTDLTGRTPAGIAPLSLAVGATYTAPVSETAKLIFHTDFQFDSAYTVAEGLPYREAPETLNASLTLQLSRGLEFTLWGRNLSDPRYISVVFPSVAQSGSLSGYPSPPRTYGGLIRYRF